MPGISDGWICHRNSQVPGRKSATRETKKSHCELGGLHTTPASKRRVTSGIPGYPPVGRSGQGNREIAAYGDLRYNS